MLLCAPLNGFDRHCGSCHSRQHIVHKCMLRCACVCVCVLYNRYVGACVMSSVTKPDKIYCRKNAKTRKTQASVANALRRSPSSGWHPLPLLLSITSCRDCIAETTTTKKTENLLCTDDKTFCVCVRGRKKAGQQLQETIETESLGGSEVLKVEALKCRNTHTHNHTHTHSKHTLIHSHTSWHYFFNNLQEGNTSNTRNTTSNTSRQKQQQQLQHLHLQQQQQQYLQQQLQPQQLQLDVVFERRHQEAKALQFHSAFAFSMCRSQGVNGLKVRLERV